MVVSRIYLRLQLRLYSSLRVDSASIRLKAMNKSRNKLSTTWHIADLILLSTEALNDLRFIPVQSEVNCLMTGSSAVLSLELNKLKGTLTQDRNRTIRYFIGCRKAT